MSRLRKHLQEIAHFEIHPEHVRANDETHRHVRKFPNQPLDGGNGRIIERRDAKNDFVLGIILRAVAAKALVSVRIQTAEGLQNRDRRSEIATEISAAA